MTKTFSLTVAAVALVIAGLASEGGVAARDRASGAQPDLAQQVATLQKTVKEQEARIVQLEDQISAVAAWFEALPIAARQLDNGLGQVRDEGFTKAGTNLRARETLLATLGSLGQSLSSGLPDLSGEKKKRRR